MKKPKTQIDRNKAAARTAGMVEAATSIVQRVPVDAASPEDGVKISLGMGDFRTMAMTYARGRIDTARAAAEDRRDQLRNAVKARANELEEQGRDLCANYITEHAEAQQLLGMLVKWIGKPHRAVLQKKGFYRGYGSEAKESEPVADLEKKVIVGEISFYSVNDDSIGSSIDALDKEAEIPFSTEMKMTLFTLNETREKLAEAETDVKELNKAMARVEEQGDVVQSRLTVAHLKGEIKTTHDILAVVQDTMLNNKVLPERVRHLLPPPEET